MLNNIDFIIYANKQLGTPYVFGTYGEKLTNSKLMWVHNTYPDYLNVTRLNYALNNSYIGKVSHDCSGLFKGYLMGGYENNVKYKSKYDLNVQSLFYASNKKYCISDYSVGELLDNFNTSIGLALCNHNFSHIIYIADEFRNNINDIKTIEAKGFDYGVVNDKLVNILTRWPDGYIFELPFIEYINISNTLPEKTQSTTPLEERRTWVERPEAHKEYYTSEDIQTIANNAIKGEYANGQIRRDILRSMGISYDMIQARINQIYKHELIKSDIEIAQEVYKGQHGNGYTRQQNLTYMGYDYRYIQKLVNDYIVNDKWG